MPDFDREDIAYTSQAGVDEQEDVPVNDQQDYSALLAIAKQAKELRKTASHINSLNLEDPKLSVETQLFGYQFALDFLEPLLQTIGTAVDKVKKQGRS